jgi:hypothetical protein
VSKTAVQVDQGEVCTNLPSLSLKVSWRTILIAVFAFSHVLSIPLPEQRTAYGSY